MRRFHQGNRIAVVMECLSIPAGCTLHARDVPAGEHKRVKGSQPGLDEEDEEEDEERV